MYNNCTIIVSIFKFKKQLVNVSLIQQTDNDMTTDTKMARHIGFHNLGSYFAMWVYLASWMELYG